MVNDVQVGIISFIINDCGTSTSYEPSGYTRLSSFSEWISNVTNLVYL